ncbi:Fc.00g088240.m01.CDS01 [Cosmosporella sp. VM-42]
MGGPPAYLFVVRHGNRLDAADKKWHITSPTPYDPPLTYGGFLQARQVGNQIAGILEQAKVEHEVCSKNEKRRKFKVVIHSSPFLRCIQTSIAISSGLAQTPPESPYHPSDVIVSATSPYSKPDHFRSSILRVDSFLGEWLSPEYFEMITPPPGSALMVGSAKADLLRREDYSALIPAHNHTNTTSSGSLWNGSPGASPAISAMQSTTTSEKDGSIGTSAMAAALSGQLANSLAQKKGYAIPKPNYAISSAGKIPDGFVAHARDECVVVDYQWDSMRPPLDFGDGGQFGEEWTSMHKRFRRGLKKMLDWYATTEAPDEMVTRAAGGMQDDTKDKPTSSEDEEVETVVILVSHGAGCNALIGAITHQPVLMDVGIASITMAVRKQDVKYQDLLLASQAEDPASEPHVSPHQLYDIRMSASTEHLRSTASTPASSRSASAENAFSAPGSVRGRVPSISDGNGPVIASFIYSEPIIPNGNRSTSASATMGTSVRRSSGSQRPPSRSPALATGRTVPRDSSPGSGISYGLWAPAPSSLRLMDGFEEESDSEDFDALLPNFDQHRFKTSELYTGDTTPSAGIPVSNPMDSTSEPPSFEPRSAPSHTELPPPALPTFTPFSIPSIITSNSGSDTPRSKPRGPILAGPIRIRTNVEFERPAEDYTRQLGDGLGGLWGLPRPPGEAEMIRDLSLSKRRWTTTERAQF